LSRGLVVGLGALIALSASVLMREARASHYRLPVAGFISQAETDLLRIEGIGPRMARLLTAAGVRDTRALGGEVAPALLARMTSANETGRFASVLPREGLVAAWVAAARRLPQVIEGLP